MKRVFSDTKASLEALLSHIYESKNFGSKHVKIIFSFFLHEHFDECFRFFPLDDIVLFINFPKGAKCRINKCATRHSSFAGSV